MYRQDQTLLSAILGSCSDIIQPIISSASSSKEAWERLLHSYANASRSRIISLKSKLAKNLKGNKSVAEFLNEMRSIADELALIQNPISEEDLVVHIITQLGDEFNSLTYADFGSPDEIFLGDGNSHPISHTSNTQIYTSHKSLALSNVLCVPNLRQNLISIAKLCKSNSVSVKFFSSHFLVKDLRTRAPLLRRENIGNNTKFLDEFVNNLSIKFPIKDLGTLHQFLGVEVISTPFGLFLSQHQLIADLLSRFNMAGAKEALNIVLHYLKGTIHQGLFLNRKSPTTLTTFSNSDWGGIKDNGCSTIAYILYLGPNIISWRSALQKSVFCSSTEAEYKALTNASAEMMWVQNLLHELGISLQETPTLFYDNTCATYLCTNPMYHSRMKHVSLDNHFVRERVSEGSLRVLHISSKDQLVDMLTKPLGRSQFMHFRSKIGVSDGSSILRGRVKDKPKE
nr:hypothetical protein [Tanacetum cinerariifolium]